MVSDTKLVSIRPSLIPLIQCGEHFAEPLLNGAKMHLSVHLVKSVHIIGRRHNDAIGVLHIAGRGNTIRRQTIG